MFMDILMNKTLTPHPGMVQAIHLQGIHKDHHHLDMGIHHHLQILDIIKDIHQILVIKVTSITMGIHHHNNNNHNTKVTNIITTIKVTMDVHLFSEDVWPHFVAVVCWRSAAAVSSLVVWLAMLPYA